MRNFARFFIMYNCLNNLRLTISHVKITRNKTKQKIK